MSHRSVKIAILFLLLLLPAGGLYAALPQHAGSAGQTVPNIILILTDDQHWSSVPDMPYVSQKLAGNSTTYSNAFVATSTCCPSRATIFTGLYAYHHGVLTGVLPLGGATMFDDTDTVATRLHDAGYRTGLFGKYLNDYETLVANEGPYVPPGWDTWFAFVDNSGNELGFYYDYEVNDNGSLVLYGTEPEDYSTDVLATQVVDFITSGSTPFFLQFSPWAPHGKAVPAVRHEEAFAGVAPYRPPNFNIRMSDPPLRLADRLPLTEQQIADFDLERQHQLEALLAVDEAVGLIVRTLRQTGQLENTLIVFMSDNGLQWGELALRGKAEPYEGASRVPLIIRWPGQQTPATVDQMVLNIDLAPTFMALAGHPYQPTQVDGRSLVDLENQQPRGQFLMERWKGQDPNRKYVCVRTRLWKYCTSEVFTTDMELYDLSNDPYEMANLAYEPAYASVLAEMQTRLASLLPPDAP